MKTIQEYVTAIEKLRRLVDMSHATSVSAVLVPEPVLPELLLYTRTYIPSSVEGRATGRALTLADMQDRAEVRVKGRFQLAGFPIVDVPELREPYVVMNNVPFHMETMLRKLEARINAVKQIEADRPKLGGLRIEQAWVDEQAEDVDDE